MVAFSSLVNPRPESGGYFSEFLLEKCIGEGSWSTVFSASQLDDEERTVKYAVKFAKLNLDQIAKEIEIYEYLRTQTDKCKFAPEFYWGCLNEEIPALITSLEGPSFATVAKQCPGGKVDAGLLVRLARHSVVAYMKLHEHNILHVDVSPKKLLLRGVHSADSLLVVIADFSQAHISSDEDGNRIPCTKLMMSPFTSWPASRGLGYEECDDLQSLAHCLLQIAGFFQFDGIPSSKSRTMRQKLFEDSEHVFRSRSNKLFFDLFGKIFDLEKGDEIDYMAIFKAIKNHPLYDRKEDFNTLTAKFS